ncbi:hypothetical protein LTR94_038142, partial [Friedmanniomyces endolithicus]
MAAAQQAGVGGDVLHVELHALQLFEAAGQFVDGFGDEAQHRAGAMVGFLQLHGDDRDFAHGLLDLDEERAAVAPGAVVDQ